MFSQEELSPINSGLQLYIRLLGFFHSPNPLHIKWISDEYDLKAALQSLVHAYKSTEPMIGVRKYQGVDYDPEREVLRTMTTYLLSGRDEKEQALLYKRNQPMMQLVIRPICRMMSKYSHRTQLDTIEAVVDDVNQLLNQTNCYGDYDDAVCAMEETRKLTQAHEEAEKAIRESKKRTKKRKRDPLIAMILGTQE